jgi:hypothetical protein
MGMAAHEASRIRANILRESFLPETMRRALKIVLGILLILIGVFALLTPLTPGSWLALIGLEILGIRILLERKLISILPHKYRRRVRNLFKRKVKKQ